MKKVLILLILPILLYSQAKKLTLNECLEIGIKNSKELKISSSKNIYAESKIAESVSQMLPQVKFSAGYSRLSDVDPFQISVPFSPTPIKISDVILDNYSMRVSLTQPLFTGFRLINQKAFSDLNSKAQEMDYNKETNEVAFKIRTAFWNLYKSELTCTLLEENLSQMKKHVEDARSYLNNGLINKNDLLKIQVQESNIRMQSIEARNNLDVAKMVLNQTLGIDLNAAIEINDKIDNSDTQVDPEKIVSEAIDNRSEIGSMKLRTLASEKAINIAEAGWMPAVFLFGNFYYNNPNQRYQPPVTGFKTTWDLGVTLSWDIWNWGYTSAQITQATQNNVQLQTSLEQMKETVEIETRQAYLLYTRLNEKLSVAQQNKEQSDENYNIVNQKFTQQLVSSSELIDAQTNMLSGKTNYYLTLVELELAKSKLLKTLGRKIY